MKHQKGNAYPKVARPVPLPDLLPGRTAGAFWRVARAWATYGTGGYPPRVARRLAVINVLSAMVSLMTVPYIALYLAWDAKALWLPAVTLSPQIVLFAVTPLWNRVNDWASGLHLCIVWLFFAVLYTWYFGRDSGLHFYFLPGVAASMLVFGADRLRLSVTVTLIAFAGFVLTEQFFRQPAPFIPDDPVFADIMFFITVPFSFFLVYATVLFAFREAARAEDALEMEHQRSERLLANILPGSIAQRLKARPDRMIADGLATVTILFADVVDFTPRAGRLPAAETVNFLNRIFSAFDDLAARHGLEKIKTVGDAYMVAGGLPDPQTDHVAACARMALDMMEAVRLIGNETGETIELRIGIHCGPVIAGVIGTRKYAYDVWGDTVNIAARLQEHSVPGGIQASAAVEKALQGRFVFEHRGPVDMKGVGTTDCFFLRGIAAGQA